MSDNASIKNDAGESEGHGLSILDVVKHAVKTIIHSLEPCDRISVVAFESFPHLWFPLIQATQTNREYMESKVDEMETMGGTDLWLGLKAGMDLLLDIPEQERAKRLPTLLVLTDGIPDYNPATQLRQYKELKKHLPNLNTFGFGYALQTDVLMNIAREGNGMHAFIPDASFVGTAFVNAISNLMVTNATNVTLSVEPENGLKIEEVIGHQNQDLSWGRLIEMCSLQFGQSKDAVLRVSTPTKGDSEEETPAPKLTVTLKYQSAIEPKENTLEAECTCAGEDGGVALEVQKLRLNMASKLLEIASPGAKIDREATQQALLDSANGIEDPHAKGMYEDIKGQVKEAIQRQPEDYFSKWGIHYLPSLSRAHLLQQCNNFKDPGIQFYGGAIFHELRDKIEDIFVKLPPPKPSANRYGGGGNYASLSSMSAYYNASGGCIAGECVVSMADGSEKRVDQIAKGDKVASSITGAGSSSEVVCVVRTHCYNGRESLVTLPGGLRLTPYHPVRVNDAWKFPLDLVVPHRDARCDFVYNFVLRGETHAMVVNGIECVTLGHGMEGDVVAHPYFGTQCVVDDLRKMRGFAQGCVELFPAACGGKTMVRDAKSGLVSGFAQGVDAIPSGACEL
eukprot:Phypoly_transcript_02932.p1 GENE.Phypoly_transcript_02932~~Phypoly_transcript_02932.p1  ORF type:complete len:623 (+),score=142.69 Phypoly_transcript_02932:708-2576(+)